MEEAPLSNELVSLHEINEWTVGYFCLDGLICDGDHKRYVQGVPFKLLSIGNYGELDRPTVGSNIWIQSLEGQKSGIWYRLRTPAPGYRRYHEPFLWMADLAKHVVDFLSMDSRVTLNNFREDFYDWLQRLYGSDVQVGQWLERNGRKDFRGILASQANFLFCQAIQVDKKLNRHPLWSEVHPRFLNAVREHVEQRAEPEMFALSKDASETVSRRKTTVTPYVYDCFRHLPWAKFLYCQTPSIGDTPPYNNTAGQALTTERPKGRSTVRSAPKNHISQDEISIGDVIALPRDKFSAWKTTDTDWYGYVQSIKDTKIGRTLGVLWLYRPSDTQCLQMRFPFANELFLSDHCNCGDPLILVQEVIRKPRVAFFSGPDTTGVDFFVRQRYVQGDGAWETLEESDFTCDCQNEKAPAPYSVGDTLLVKFGKSLEPVAFAEDCPNNMAGTVKVRRLLRKNRDLGFVDAAPNELVITNRCETVLRTGIYRRCHVRVYTEVDNKHRRIPPPYDRQGMGDFYYISSQALEDDISTMKPITRPLPLPLNQGWDPLAVSIDPPMQGLDIFCGGGNLGRGLEEGGAVHFKWAVDWYNEAIHTYKANLKDHESTMLFYGSVNDYLTQALQSKGGIAVAQRGQVEFIAAGNPCQGFSLANMNKGNDRSLFNASMVASVVAFVDFYRPKYALMENVKGMAIGSDTNNVMAQVICAFVGMGYQVRTFALDAWNFGSPQSRSRIFISIAAAGLTPLPEPPHTHSHPNSVVGASLGRTANGLHTSSRYTTLTPFEYITTDQATRDLPRTDARTSCIPYPDHRMPRPLSTLSRVRISSIPRFPDGGTFITAFNKGYMPQAQIDDFDWSNSIRTRKDSKSWQRVKRNALMPTIMTDARPYDGLCGTCLHWDEDRLLTMMEVRRGQGYPDDEVIVGLGPEQWKIIGNSVARPVALALGMSLRTAWLANHARLQAVTDKVKAASLKVVNGWMSDQPGMRQRLAVIDGGAASNRWGATDLLQRLKTALTPSKPLAPVGPNFAMKTSLITSVSPGVPATGKTDDPHVAQPGDRPTCKSHDLESSSREPSKNGAPQASPSNRVLLVGPRFPKY